MTYSNTAFVPTRDLLASVLRTLVPYIVGIIMTQLAEIGLGDFPSSAVEQLVTLGLAIGYYSLARFLEQKYSTLGWLLGLPSMPVYPGLQPVPSSTEVNNNNVLITGSIDKIEQIEQPKG